MLIVAISPHATLPTDGPAGDLPPSAWMDRLSSDATARFRETYTFHPDRLSLEAELGRLARECSAAGWDGGHASAADPRSFRRAIALIRGLPPGLEPTGVSIEGDGCAHLEWYRGPDQIVEASVAPEGSLHYASKIGSERRRGTLPGAFGTPSTFEALLGRWNRW